MLKRILFEKSAVKIVLEYLRSYCSYQWRSMEAINNGRYYVIYGNPNIAVILKKEWFLKYAEIMEKELSLIETGIGDSINTEDLRLMIQRSVKEIYIMHCQGNIYKIPIKDFLLKSHKWRNKEGKEVNSLSIHEYERVN